MVTLTDLISALHNAFLEHFNNEKANFSENDDGQVTISLATARSNVEIKDAAGNSISGMSCTVWSLDGNITIKFDSATGPTHAGWSLQSLSWPQMIQFNRNFSKIYVTNTAQPGKTCILYIGKHT